MDETIAPRHNVAVMLNHNALISFMLVAAMTSASPGHTLNSQQDQNLKTWLAQHSEFRVATDADCECDEDIQNMRSGYGGQEKPIPDYHPFIATGDFNNDGKEDFAVVVIDRNKTKLNFTLLIFNGPYESQPPSPAFRNANLDLRRHGLFFGPPRPKPYRLVLGPFESDNSAILVPHGHTYKLAW